MRVGPSPHSKRLRAIAARYAPCVPDAIAVAVTGSAGRGDAEAESDLDLWVIADVEGVAHDVFEGVPITMMRESPARVLDLEHLSGVEVELTHVVHDPHGSFARVMALFAEHADAIRKANVAGATERLSMLLADSHAGTAPGRLWMLRAAAHLAAALRIYEGTGLMMPKMRHLRAWLPARAYHLLRAIEGIDDVEPVIGALVRRSAGIADRMAAQLAQLPRSSPTSHRAPLAIATPHNALLKLAQGNIEDGVLVLRGFFEASFVEPVLAAVPDISMVRFLRELCDPQIRAYWQMLYGLGNDDDALDLKVDDDTLDLKVDAARAALCELLGLLDIDHAPTTQRFAASHASFVHTDQPMR
jgi:hypothetical protein